jgi:hypothetical protein
MSYAVKAIINSGPDFTSNQFCVYFQVEGENKNFVDKNLFRFINDEFLLNTRIQSIKIPSKKISTYTQEVFSGKFENIEQKIEDDGKSSFVVEMDALLDIMYVINILVSGSFSFKTNTINTQNWSDNAKLNILVYTGKALETRGHDYSWEELGNNVLETGKNKNSFSNASEHSGFISSMDRSTVTHQYFMFEDVKFLGTSEGISFDSNANTMQTKTINFIYKNCGLVEKEMGV